MMGGRLSSAASRSVLAAGRRPATRAVVLCSVEAPTGWLASLIRRGLDGVSQLLEAGRIRPTIDEVFSFDQAARAHRRIEERRNVGKVVLVPTC